MDATANIRSSLGNLVRIAAGYPFRGAIDVLPRGEVAAIQMRDIDRDGEIDWSALPRVSLPSNRPSTLLAEGDVIFTTRGRRNLATALRQPPFPVVCSPHFFVLKVRDRTVLDPRFLAWQLNQRPAQEHFQREATGSYILNITRSAIEGVAIMLPPMVTQRAIVALDEATSRERAVLAGLVENRNRQMEAIALRLHARHERNRP